MPAGDLYALLGVDRSASDAEIKKAYFRGVREHSPEKDPEQFKLIRSAYETLSDPTARRDYDTMQAFGGEIETLNQEAEDLIEREEWTEAAKRYKRILVLHPESSAARNSLGMCYMQADDYEAAIKTFSQLVTQSPDSVAYWMNLGFAQLHRAEEQTERSRAWMATLKAAQDAFYKAVLLDPINSDAHQGVALVRREFDDWDGAATWLQSAVSADGETDLHDVDALCQLCVVYVISEKHDKLSETLQRLVDLTPDDDEAREYIAVRLAVLGSQMAKASRFEEARAAFDHALKLNPHDENMRNARDYAVHVSQGMTEWKRLEHDSRVIPPIKAFALASLAHAEGADIEDWRIEQATRALFSYPRRKVSSSLDRVETTYPSLYWLNSEWFDRVSSQIGRVKRQPKTPAVTPALSGDHSHPGSTAEGPPRSRRRPALLALVIAILIVGAVAVAAVFGVFDGPEEALSSRNEAVVASVQTLDEGLHAWAESHDGLYPRRLTFEGLQGYVPVWPSNGVTHLPIEQGTDPGDYYYSPSSDLRSYYLDGYGEDGTAIVRLGD